MGGPVVQCTQSAWMLRTSLYNQIHVRGAYIQEHWHRNGMQRQVSPHHHASELGRISFPASLKTVTFPPHMTDLPPTLYRKTRPML